MEDVILQSLDLLILATNDYATVLEQNYKLLEMLPKQKANEVIQIPKKYNKK